LITIATNSCERLPCVYLYVLTMGHREPRVGSNTYTTARRTRNAGPGNPDDVGAAHLGSARDRHARSSSRLSSHGWDAPRTERTDRGPFRASRRNRFVKRGGARRATSAGMQTGPGSRGECNGVLVVRENDTGASPVARSSGGQLRARCRAPQERGTGDGGRGTGEGGGGRCPRVAGRGNLAATEEHAARAAPLRGPLRTFPLAFAARPPRLAHTPRVAAPRTPPTGTPPVASRELSRFIEPPPFNSGARCPPLHRRAGDR